MVSRKRPRFFYTGVLPSTPVRSFTVTGFYLISLFIISRHWWRSSVSQKIFFFKKCECFMCVGRLILGAALLGLVDLIWIVSAELTRKGLISDYKDFWDSQNEISSFGYFYFWDNSFLGISSSKLTTTSPFSQHTSSPLFLCKSSNFPNLYQNLTYLYRLS